ncbi:unnamed protein product, partial [Tetraodon nigroviridis]
ISMGFHQVTLGERGRRRWDFTDTGVNTRQAMEHVKESKTGLLDLDFFAHIRGVFGHELTFCWGFFFFFFSLGTSGAPISLTANFFQIVSRPQWVLYQYHVDYKPSIDSRRLRSALLFQHEVLGIARTFDGSLLFLPHRLHNKETVLHSKTHSGEEIQITVTLTNELPPTSPMCIQFYNIIFRRQVILKVLNLQQIGRNYYNPNDPLNIPQHRLTIWPGYTATILPYESAIMMCTDISHKVLRSETALDFMVNLKHQCGIERFHEICTKELVGLVVLTKYNNRTYRIDDIAWDHTPSNTFKRGAADISFKDYYRNQYGLEIADGNQVLLVSYVKRMGPSGGPAPGPAMLIPELCYLTGLTNRMRSDFSIMKDLSTHTKLMPEQREQRLNRFMANINRNADARGELEKWGLAFDRELLNVNGRLLPGEKIFQGSRSFNYDPMNADWNREMRGLSVTSAPHLDNWLLFYTCRIANDAQTLLQNLLKVSGPLGIRLQRPTMIEYEDRQDRLLRAIQQNVGPHTQMVVVILPTNRKDKYDSIKKYLCVDCPVPSQCVVAQTLSRPQTLLNVATKIALQMACKMGGELWSVEIPLKHLMVVGIDCYHDISAGKRSVGALVASMNQTMSRWFSRCVLQQKGQEIMDGLKRPFIDALKEYLKHNNCLPSRIIVYRDGVGDGQLQSVATFEVAQILESIKSLGQDYRPKLSVVVVKKRIATRFFARIGGKTVNPPPGTVIDTEVTRPEWYDFYIVSQAVRSGSVAPTHYNVIHDTSGLKPDHMQTRLQAVSHVLQLAGLSP